MRLFRSLLILSLPVFLGLGLWGGLGRMGWWAMPLPKAALGHHGLLLVVGFLGTLIGLERALQTAQLRLWLAVSATFTGTLLLLLGLDLAFSLWLILAGITCHLLSFWPQRSLSQWSSWLGLLCWLAGTLTLFWPQARSLSTLWWMGFLVLTIRSSHLKPALHPPGSAFGLVNAWTLPLIPLGCLSAMLWPELGLGLSAVGFLAQAAAGGWQIPTLAAQSELGQPRWLRATFSLAYLWLGLGGSWLLAGVTFWQGRGYDLIAHAIFVGFVLGMIMAHAPGVLPRLLGRQGYVFHPLLWLPLLLLQGSLWLRSLAGWAAEAELKAWGGMFNAVSLLLFMGLLAWLCFGKQGRVEAK